MKSFISEKKKGFTLIELLAVLVVLAIIALIAIPIVINIISDARANSNRRSIDSYGKAAEYAATRWMESEDYTSNYTSDQEEAFRRIEKYIDYKGKTVTCNVKKCDPTNGNIYLTDCSVGGSKIVKKQDSSYNYEYKTDMHGTFTNSH